MNWPSDDTVLGDETTRGGQRARRRARSLEAAAIAGVLYTVLTLAALVLLSRIPDLSLSDAEMTSWFDDTGHQAWLILGLNLASVSAIALLWFVAVIRRRLGDREDRFFGTVFFGSGIAYAVVWVTAAAMVAAPAVAMNALGARSVGADSVSLSAGLGASLLLVVAPRLQAVFILTVSNLIIRSGFLPRWVAYVGFLTGLIMFIVPLVTTSIGLSFPIWVLLVSIVILLNRPTMHDRVDSDDEPDDSVDDL
jgi:MFS family permease